MIDVTDLGPWMIMQPGQVPLPKTKVDSQMYTFLSRSCSATRDNGRLLERFTPSRDLLYVTNQWLNRLLPSLKIPLPPKENPQYSQIEARALGKLLYQKIKGNLARETRNLWENTPYPHIWLVCQEVTEEERRRGFEKLRNGYFHALADFSFHSGGFDIVRKEEAGDHA